MPVPEEVHQTQARDEEGHNAQDPPHAGHQTPEECCSLGLEAKKSLLHAEDLDMEKDGRFQTPQH